MPDDRNLLLRSTLLALIVLTAFPTPLSAEESPSSRVKAYMTAVARAKTLGEVKPYFSKVFWDYTYAPLEDTPVAEQTRLLADTAADIKGFTVVGESVSGNKATVSMKDPQGQTSPLLMVKENGTWVIDLEDPPESFKEEE